MQNKRVSVRGPANIILNMKNKDWKKLADDISTLEQKRAKEKGKCYGECESCGEKTVLVKEVGLCGPCCFGEADTIMGNW